MGVGVEGKRRETKKTRKDHRGKIQRKKQRKKQREKANKRLKRRGLESVWVQPTADK